MNVVTLNTSGTNNRYDVLNNSYKLSQPLYIDGEQWLNPMQYLYCMKYRGSSSVANSEYAKLIENMDSHFGIQLLGEQLQNPVDSYKYTIDNIEIHDVIEKYKGRVKSRNNWGVSSVYIMAHALYNKAKQFSEFSNVLMSVSDNTYFLYKNHPDHWDDNDNVIGRILTIISHVLKHGSCIYMSQELKENTEMITLNLSSIEKNGPHTLLYESGRESSCINYKHGVKDGTTKWWFDNGVLALKNTWSMNKLEGISVTYYRTGNIHKESYWVDNKLNGHSKTWHANGVVKKENEWVNGRKDGLELSWYENGIPKTEGYYIDGLLEGIYRTWDGDGRIVYLTSFKNGKLVHEIPDIRTYVTTYETGRKLREESADGKKQGMFTSVYENRDKWASESHWVNNKQTGPAISWYINGRVRSTSVWKNGKKHGVSKYYDNKGILIRVSNYSNDKIDNTVRICCDCKNLVNIYDVICDECMNDWQDLVNTSPVSQRCENVTRRVKASDTITPNESLRGGGIDDVSQPELMDTISHTLRGKLAGTPYFGHTSRTFLNTSNRKDILDSRRFLRVDGDVVGYKKLSYDEVDLIEYGGSGYKYIPKKTSYTNMRHGDILRFDSDPDRFLWVVVGYHTTELLFIGEHRQVPLDVTKMIQNPIRFYSESAPFGGNMIESNIPLDPVLHRDLVYLYTKMSFKDTAQLVWYADTDRDDFPIPGTNGVISIVNDDNGVLLDDDISDNDMI
jgi:antitoxin component YwqK of YwqJK toxin-antitoxin module